MLNAKQKKFLALFDNQMWNELVEGGYINIHGLTQKAFDELSKDVKINTLSIAETLKSMWPKGSRTFNDRSGCKVSFPWTDGVTIIEKRINSFLQKYDPDGKFTEEEFIDAARRYLNDKDDGRERYGMESLKYFIWKNEKGVDGDVEYKSSLLRYLEDKELGKEKKEEQQGFDLLDKFV